MYVALYGAIACIIVYAIIWVCAQFGFPLPAMIQKLLWLVVLIYVLIMLVRLLFGVGGVPRFL